MLGCRTGSQRFGGRKGSRKRRAIRQVDEDGREDEKGERMDLDGANDSRRP